MKMRSNGNGKSRRIGREGENAHHLFDKMPKRTAYYLSIKNFFFADVVNMCQKN